MTWYAQSGPRTKDLGKFRLRSREGTENSAGGTYRGWSYSFVTHQTGSSVRRTCYSISLKDAHGNQAAYLRDFSSVDQAVAAAQEWIDSTFRFTLPTAIPGDVGTIPAPPTSAATQK